MLIRSLVILVGVVGLVASWEKDAYACDELSSQLVARSYILTMPLLGRDNEMIPLMQNYPDHFSEGGGAIRCMQRLGSALINGGLAHYSEFSGTSAQERFGNDMPLGLEHLPGEVDQSMGSYGSDIYAMGQELIWLADVLPAAAQGYYDPYTTTGTQTRLMMRNMLPMYQMLCSMDPSICQVMLDMLNQMVPQIEQQIYALARQAG